jgi:hypothetical protein
MSRTPSNTTAIGSRQTIQSPRVPTERSVRKLPPPKPAPTKSPQVSDAESSSSSSSSEDEDEVPLGMKSQILARPKYGARKGGVFSPASSSSDEESPAFLPFSKAGPAERELRHEPSNISATLRGGLPPRNKPPAVDSSATSSSSSMISHKGPQAQQGKALPPVSNTSAKVREQTNAYTRRMVAMAGSGGKLSPHHRHVQTGSEGTPSMGSSFSDLDGMAS